MEVVYILKELIIDVPDTFDQPYLLQQKVFEFLEHGSTKYIKNFCILYRIDKLSSKHIEKLISDWDVKSIGYAPEGNSGKDKVNIIKEMCNLAQVSLVFFDYNLGDMGTKVMIDQCLQKDVYLKTCRLDLDNKIT